MLQLYGTRDAVAREKANIMRLVEANRVARDWDSVARDWDSEIRLAHHLVCARSYIQRWEQRLKTLEDKHRDQTWRREK